MTFVRVTTIKLFGKAEQAQMPKACSAQPLHSQQPTDADMEPPELALTGNKYVPVPIEPRPTNDRQGVPLLDIAFSDPLTHSLLYPQTAQYQHYVLSRVRVQGLSSSTAYYTGDQVMALPHWVVPAALALLMIDSIIELSFISSMVAWLHSTAGGQFEIIAPDNSNTMSFSLHGKPKNLLTNQGHTSNGAAGTAFVLVGLGGILILTLRHHAWNNPKFAKLAITLYYFWLVSTVLSALLTLAALAYTFAVGNQTKGQHIDVAVAASLNNRPYPNYVAYPLDDWTPDNWFVAVLELTLASRSQRSNIEHHLTIMRGWKWNLIPMFLLGVALSTVAIVDAWSERKVKSVRGGKFEPMRKEGEIS
jgi:hypothetical protein